MDLVDLCYLDLYQRCLQVLDMVYILSRVTIIQKAYRKYKHFETYKYCMLQIIEIGASPPLDIPLLQNGGYIYRESLISFNYLKTNRYIKL